MKPCCLKFEVNRPDLVSKTISKSRQEREGRKARAREGKATGRGGKVPHKVNMRHVFRRVMIIPIHAYIGGELGVRKVSSGGADEGFAERGREGVEGGRSLTISSTCRGCESASHRGGPAKRGEAGKERENLNC